MKRSRVGPPGSAETERDRSRIGGPGGASSSPETAPSGWLSRWKVLVAVSILALIVIATGLGYQFGGFGPRPLAAAAALPTSFAGSDACASCHQAEAELWQTSQHRHAMDHAGEKTVLGDFHDATFENHGVRSRFFRAGDKFMVETDGPDGKLASFEIKYTFGVDPLQQYLIELPGGRVQALTIAWDTRPKEKGGQRWFSLYPNETIPHDDVLHWTKLNQNWNFMCAECHSTGVRKNYDAANDRYATTFAEINVGCEACHGQGSAHVAWARAKKSWWPFGKSDDPTMGLLARFDDRTGASWVADPATGNPHRSAPPDRLRKEVETCGLCHARRAGFSEDWKPGQWLSNTHAVAELSARLYAADGQMLDEVYNYGSFKQSKMFAAGVTCSDCHDPHSAALRLPGDGVCLQCHAPAKYETVAHNHHQGTSSPLACASCHMPARTYMVVDKRHDHSFRIPRPDISARLGTPNACTDCHSDKSAQWAAAAVETWFGPERKGFQHYADAFQAARTDLANASELLAVVVKDADAPAVARATALNALAPYLAPANLDLARGGLRDLDPMVRIGALDMIRELPLDQRWPLVSPLLSDPVRGVRTQAASIVADAPNERVPPQDRDRFDSASAEFVAAQQLNADRPEGRASLGDFYARRGRAGDAEAEYRAALRLSPQFAPAAVNLADLYRQLGRDADSEKVLRAALANSSNDAGLHYSLGLSVVRLKRLDEALVELGRASELAPGSARYAYVYAVALNSAGRHADAISRLKDSIAEHPTDRDTLLALVTFSRDAGDLSGALGYAERLAAAAPGDRSVEGLVEELRRQAGAASGK